MNGVDIDGLIRLAYEAASGQRRWEEFAGRLAAAIHYDWVMICHEDRQRPQRSISAAYNVQPSWLERYTDCFQHDNPYHDFVAQLDPPAGEVLLLDDTRLEARVAQSSFYREYMRPQEMSLKDNIYVAVLNDSLTRSALVLQRRLGNDGPTEPALELCRILMPHLQTALQIHRKLRELESAHSGLRAALDRLPHGIALLDAAGHVLVLNRRASDSLDARDGLAVEGGDLRALEPDAPVLQRAIARATSGSRGEGEGSTTVLHLRRPSKRRPYELLLCPLDEEDSLEPGLRPAAVVFITDPDNDKPLSTAEALRETYGLTRRESQVALGVLRGETIQEIADALELGRETVKTHLAGVYGKTGCRGQAELVRRLLLGVGALQSPLVAQ